MSTELDPVTRDHLERGVEGLVDEFRGIFSRETIDRYVQESLQDLPAARFTDFIPLLVHRFARERLRALGQAEGTIAKDVPEVLFVCVQNSGRSQMAAGLLHQRAAGLVHVRSAVLARRTGTSRTRKPARHPFLAGVAGSQTFV